MNDQALIEALDRGDLLPIADFLEVGGQIPARSAKCLAILIRSGVIGFVDRDAVPVPNSNEDRDKRIWAFMHVRQASGYRLKKQILHEASERFNVSEATAKLAGQKWERTWASGGDARDLLVWPYWLDAFKELCSEVGAEPFAALSSIMAANSSD